MATDPFPKPSYEQKEDTVVARVLQCVPCCTKGCPTPYIVVHAEWDDGVAVYNDVLYKAAHLIDNNQYADWLGTPYFADLEIEYDSCAWFNIPSNNVNGEFWWVSEWVFDATDEFGSPLPGAPFTGLDDVGDPYSTLGTYEETENWPPVAMVEITLP